MVRPTLDRSAVREWLLGQRAAAERIETERVHFLLALTPERSLRLYLDYLSYTPQRGGIDPHPPFSWPCGVHRPTRNENEVAHFLADRPYAIIEGLALQRTPHDTGRGYHGACLVH